MAEEKSFDPNKYLTQLQGKEYLEVKWRIAWLRAEHPDATIDTQLERYDDNSAVFKASVHFPDGGFATGYGSETKGDFRDYVEKAETKAVGRALAHLGYGTQFAVELDEGGTVADSPVQRTRPAQPTQPTQNKPRPVGMPEVKEGQKRTDFIICWENIAQSKDQFDLDGVREQCARTRGFTQNQAAALQKMLMQQRDYLNSQVSK
ncbi:MAG: hypothetical protein PHQ43_10205 [Dehalococcoidales bacterium]|nr:hypothetical protein [Dehalococcoidales bacterium]